MSGESKKYRAAVGAVVCNVANYIQEWCCFQYLTGFDKIIICLDRTTDDTYAKIQKLPQKVLDRVDVFSNPTKHEHALGHNFQARGYGVMYAKYKDDVEWLAMFDDDEYIYDHKKRNIHQLLDVIPDVIGILPIY